MDSKLQYRECATVLRIVANTPAASKLVSELKRECRGRSVSKRAALVSVTRWANSLGL